MRTFLLTILLAIIVVVVLFVGSAFKYRAGAFVVNPRISCIVHQVEGRYSDFEDGSTHKTSERKKLRCDDVVYSGRKGHFGLAPEIWAKLKVGDSLECTKMRKPAVGLFDEAIYVKHCRVI